MARIIYQDKPGRTLLLCRTRGSVRIYSVEIAGGEYGPFPWSEALAWYRRHKRTK
jgi:hypothetical protein